MKFSATVALTAFLASSFVSANRSCTEGKLYCYSELSMQGQHNADRFINKQNREALVKGLPFEEYKEPPDFVFKCLIGGDVNLVAVAYECKEGPCSPTAVRNPRTGAYEAGCSTAPETAAQRNSNRFSIAEKLGAKRATEKARKMSQEIPDTHWNDWWASEP